ncbi:MAG TPA: tetratricopeptide repeat protein [Rhodocyclaceae bacterium]|nr:tetratricopeptide repeat protein [Rhodocyclaceae bacterium]
MKAIAVVAASSVFLALSLEVSALEIKQAAPMHIVTMPEPAHITPSPAQPHIAPQPPTSVNGRSPTQTINSLLAQGNALARQQRFQEAIEAYSRAIDINSNYDVIWYNRGLVYASLGPNNYGQAWKDFSRAIDLNPGNDRAFLNRAMLNKYAGRQQYYLDDLNMAANLGNQKAQSILSAAAGNGAPQSAMATQVQGSNARPPVDAPAAMFGRDWRLRVPGAAYQTENVVAGTRTTHVSTGTGQLPHVVNISTNGTYVWKAYGQIIQGQWVAGVKRGYPLTLMNGYEGKNWNATISDGQLLLWDGNSLAGQFRGS